MNYNNKSGHELLLAVANRLNDVREDVTEIKITMARNTASLEEHMRRTSLLEKQIEPIKSHVTMVSNVLKIIGFLAIVLSAIDKLLPLLGK